MPETMMHELQVLLVHPEPLWSTGVRQVLRHRYPKVNALFTGTGAEALEALESWRFDLTVAAAKLPDMELTDWLSHLRHRQPRLPVAFCGAAWSDGWLAAERCAWLDAAVGPGELLAAVAELLDRPTAAGMVLPCIDLTPREQEVLAALASGLRNRELTVLLNMAEATLKTHLRSLFHKLGVGNRTACVALARRRGLL